MTTQELEQVIHDYIIDIYKMKYIGRMKITKLDPVGYCIQLGMDRPYQPTTIYAEFPDDKFLKFLKQELRDRKLDLTQYGELNLIHHPNSTVCNDKG